MIIYDYQTLKNTDIIIQHTFKFNEIQREVRFCEENGIPMKDEYLEALLTQVLEACWEIFFIIYDVKKHFKYLDPEKDPQKAFRTVFNDIKRRANDIPFKMNQKAINRNFQKIFKVVGTYKALLRTLNWVMTKKGAGNWSSKF